MLQILLLARGPIQAQQRAEHQRGVVRQFAALDLAAGDDLAVIKQAVVRLQLAHRPRDDLAGLFHERRGVCLRGTFASRRQPTAAGPLEQAFFVPSLCL